MISSVNTNSYIELFHLLFLEQLGLKIDRRLYTLKGGCNLRFFLDSIRYSEDIDIDIHTIAVPTLKKTIGKILSGLPFKQILSSRDIEIVGLSESKQTNTTQRWKIQLKIQDQSLPVNTKIEFSRRAKPPEANIEPVLKKWVMRYRIRPFFVNHYAPDDAFSQKVNALINRTETQARDVFDIHHLLQTQRISHFPSLNREQLEKATANALEVTFPLFKSQVLSYLELELIREYDSEDIWNTMLSTVIDSLKLLST